MVDGYEDLLGWLKELFDESEWFYDCVECFDSLFYIDYELMFVVVNDVFDWLCDVFF